MAAKPSDWTLRGVVCGPREVDPNIQGSGWVAWAVGPDRERISGDAFVAIMNVVKYLV